MEVAAQYIAQDGEEWSVAYDPLGETRL